MYAYKIAHIILSKNIKDYNPNQLKVISEKLKIKTNLIPENR